MPELLVITGRACTRIMSGYQKNKADEAKILETLREEGLLAMPKGKTAGGLSFEVVDLNVLDSKPETENNEGDVFVSSQFMPSKTLARLELRRGVRQPCLRHPFKTTLFKTTLLMITLHKTTLHKTSLIKSTLLDTTLLREPC